MAVSLVKSDAVVIGNSATISCDLGSNPASGNLLVFLASSKTGSNAIVTPPSGFSQADYVANTDSLGGSSVMYYKVSAGTEQTVEVVFTSANTGQGIYLEYSGFGSAPADPLDTTATQYSTGTSDTTIGCGGPTSTPAEADSFAVFLAATGDQRRFNLTQTVDNSYSIEIEQTGSINRPYMAACVLELSSATAQNPTVTTTDDGDENTGIIAIFTESESGGGTPVGNVFSSRVFG